MKHPRYKVQKCVAVSAKTPSGVRVGRVWVTVAAYGRRATAETVAQRLRRDLKDQAVRVQ